MNGFLFFLFNKSTIEPIKPVNEKRGNENRIIPKNVTLNWMEVINIEKAIRIITPNSNPFNQ